MAVLLGLLAGALLVLGAALALVWLQQRNATRAEHPHQQPRRPPSTR